MRLQAMSKYSLLVSKPMKWRFSLMQATAVVPLPIVASKITPPNIAVGQHQIAQQVNRFLGGVVNLGKVAVKVDDAFRIFHVRRLSQRQVFEIAIAPLRVLVVVTAARM